jgi:DNA-binding transcriptional regulator YiaG
MDVESAQHARAKVSRLKKIGQAITWWREEIEPRISMVELAWKIGRSLSTVQRWERGSLEPKASDLQRMDKVKSGLPERLFPRLVGPLDMRYPVLAKNGK